MKEIIDENILEVVNFSSKCMGKWTHEIRTSKRRSVLDYIIVDKNMLEDIEELLIGEECLITPFRLKKMKDATTQVFSDHNAMLLKLDTKCSKKKIDHDKEEENEMGWKLSDEGLKKLGEITSGKQFNHVLTYSQFMEKVESIMNQCFRKKRIFKQKRMMK